MTDLEKTMESAFKLAEKGVGYTSPNPPVGAIIIKNNKVIAGGYHRRAGLPHAEIVALREAGEKARGSTLITTLEPCSHHGKTPPCADAIVAAGVRRVVSAIKDKNPAVNGKGYRKLRAAGIEVIDGVLRGRARRLYEPYFKFITTGLPFVTLKFAQSIDGRIATRKGDSKWISSSQSLKLSHQLRAINDAILIGNNTVKSDNPQLTTRLVRGSNPIRIVLSGSGKIDFRKTVFTDGAAPTFIALPSKPGLRISKNIITVRRRGDGLDLADLLRKLATMGIVTLLVEGGSEVLTSFFRQRAFDRLIVCIAPMIIGRGIDSIGELGVTRIVDSIDVADVEHRRLGPDTILIGRPEWS